MKRAALILALIVAISCLCACSLQENTSCSHIWATENCTNAKTCSLCGETEGTPLGHSYTAATCEKPKTCSICSETEGTPLGHSYAAATCEKPKTCSVCGKTKGSPLGHSYRAATCTTPEKCSTCGKTRGYASHQFSAATCIKPKTCSVCGYTEGGVSSHNYSSSVCTVCGATDPKYAEIQQALIDSVRYISYNESNRELLEGNIELYKMTGKTFYLKGIIDNANNIINNMDSIIRECEDYGELKLLVEACYYSLPAVSSSNTSTIAPYITAVKKLATQTNHVRAVYLALCNTYGVEVTFNN